VYFTGEPAEDAIERLAGVTDSVIEAHEAAALVSLIAVELLGVLGLAGLLLSRSRFSPMLVIRSAFGVALITAGLMAWTANLGGRIRHSELQGSAGQTTSAREHEEGNR
jgi:hypothetical protein